MVAVGIDMTAIKKAYRGPKFLLPRSERSSLIDTGVHVAD